MSVDISTMAQIMKTSLAISVLLVILGMNSLSVNGVAVDGCTNDALICERPYVTLMPDECDRCCKMNTNEAGKKFTKGTCTGENLNFQKCDCSN